MAVRVIMSMVVAVRMVMVMVRVALVAATIAGAVVAMIVILGLEEGRLDLQDPVEIERVAAEYGIERHLAALRLVQRRVGIDAADPAPPPRRARPW